LPDPALIQDNRAQIAGPGVHAFIVGVSEYQYLPEADEPPEEKTWFFNKLTSAALSAYRIYEWLSKADLRLPVKTVRLLLSTSPVERTVEPALAGLNVPTADRDTFKDSAWKWRADAAARNSDDMTFFYYSGHGLQRRPDEGIMLLADFGDPSDTKLSRCARFGSILNGMVPSTTFPRIAKTQFYFVDSCRVRPEVLTKFVDLEVPPIFDTELNVIDQREAPVWFSTLDGAVAVGRRGRPSYFAEGLVFALDRAAENPEDAEGGGTRWPVTSLTIKTALDRYYDRVGLTTKVIPGGLVGEPVLRYLNSAPDVDLAIHIGPDLLAGNCSVSLCDGENDTVSKYAPCAQMDLQLTVKAGAYRLLVDSGHLRPNSWRSKLEWITQKYKSPWRHDLTPFLGS
jgi:hypothetical protein